MTNNISSIEPQWRLCWHLVNFGGCCCGLQGRFRQLLGHGRGLVNILTRASSWHCLGCLEICNCCNLIAWWNGIWNKWLTHWLSAWLTDRLSYWLTAYPLASLPVWLTDCLTDDCLVYISFPAALCQYLCPSFKLSTQCTELSLPLPFPLILISPAALDKLICCANFAAIWWIRPS